MLFQAIVLEAQYSLIFKLTDIHLLIFIIL